jgi:hypothetical protein
MIGIKTALNTVVSKHGLNMARKLYIFNPTGKVKTDGQLPARWIGGYSANYTYLGDHRARLLGVGNYLMTNRPPQWLRGPSSTARYFRGGASRFDKEFRGWG